MNKNEKWNMIAGLYGNALEWYDFLLYASFAPIFAKQFFPSHIEFLSLLFTLGVFAVGFFMRPIGGIIFGHYGDRAGRRKMLIASISLMTLTTFCIGILPGFEEIGFLAPLLFTLLRLVQGIAIGGELPGSVAFMIETTFSRFSGLAGSLVLSTAFLGIFAGSLTAVIMTEIFSKELNFAWRYAYMIGSVLGLIGIYLRVKCSESKRFLQQQKEQRKGNHFPAKLIFTQYKFSLFVAVMLTSILAVSNYLLIAFINILLVNTGKMSLPDVLTINLSALLLLTLLIPVMGYISDLIGFKRLFLIGLFGVLLFIFPIFYCLNTYHYSYVLYGELLLSVVLSPINATVPTLVAEMFPTMIRASGISIGYNIGQAIFGGTVPLVALTLIKVTQNNFAPAWYIFLWGIAVFIALYIEKKYKRSKA